MGHHEEDGGWAPGKARDRDKVTDLHVGARGEVVPVDQLLDGRRHGHLEGLVRLDGGHDVAHVRPDRRIQRFLARRLNEGGDDACQDTDDDRHQEQLDQRESAALRAGAGGWDDRSTSWGVLTFPENRPSRRRGPLCAAEYHRAGSRGPEKRPNSLPFASRNRPLRCPGNIPAENA